MSITASAMQPLLPDERVSAPLVELAATLVEESLALGASAGSLAPALRPLLRAMNSYYTNQIEGQHTRPSDIARALEKRFDADADLARRQRLALAHIGAEVELEPLFQQMMGPERYGRRAVCRVHAALYGRLPARERRTDLGAPIEPGALRGVDVAAGQHTAPPHAAVPALLDHWGARYGALPGREQSIVGAACAHHRLLWIHPFPDGNGRAARLHLHLALSSLGLLHGLWSPLRGIARDRAQYYARLNNADLPRRNDLDGRGALSEEELVRFATWLLGVCLDQCRFMRDLLALEGLRARLRDLLVALAASPWAVGTERSVIKLEALEPLHYVALTGPLERGRFLAMTGLPPRTARRVLASLLDVGVLTETGPRSPVAFGVPLRALRHLFPRLWPEAEAELA